MVILWYGLLSSFCLAIVAMFCSLWWYCSDPSPEPLQSFVYSIAVLIVSGGGIIVQFLFDPAMLKKRQEDREKNRTTLDDVLDSIDNELKNFRHFDEKRPYSNESHQKAVEVYSFECMRESLEKIQFWWGYRSQVAKILRYLNAKDLKNIISSLQDLRPKVERDLKKRGGSAEL